MEKRMKDTGKERRSTSSAVVLKQILENVFSNQSAELADRYKPGRYQKKVSDRQKNRNEEAAAAEVAVEFVTPPESGSSINMQWLPEQSDFETFLDLIRSTQFEDENIFNGGMENIFGKVSKTIKPIIIVTTEHIKQLESFRETIPENDKIHVTAWINRLLKYLYADSDGR